MKPRLNINKTEEKSIKLKTNKSKQSNMQSNDLTMINKHLIIGIEQIKENKHKVKIIILSTRLESIDHKYNSVCQNTIHFTYHLKSLNLHLQSTTCICNLDYFLDLFQRLFSFVHQIGKYYTYASNFLKKKCN